jgi:hypothetical protein
MEVTITVCPRCGKVVRCGHYEDIQGRISDFLNGFGAGANDIFGIL